MGKGMKCVVYTHEAVTMHVAKLANIGKIKKPLLRIQCLSGKF